MPPPDTVVHVYGVLPADTIVELPRKGTLDAAVTRVSCGAYDLIVSDLPAAEFGPAVWAEHAQDPAWVGRVARQHHAVLQHVAERTDVLPLRLPSVYRNLDELRVQAGELAGRWTTAFAVVRGHSEWSVKVWRAATVPSPPEPRPTSGADYLRGKARQAARREDELSSESATVLAVHEALATVATHAAVSPPHDPAVTGRRERMLLNAAYLVPRNNQDRFFGAADEQAARIGGDGYSVEVTGPWPAYSFSHVSLEDVRTP